jgi:hypothetical protein
MPPVGIDAAFNGVEAAAAAARFNNEEFCCEDRAQPGYSSAAESHGFNKFCDASKKI